VLAIGALYIGSTILTPLYPLYRHEFRFSELVVLWGSFARAASWLVTC